jgi:cobalamin-dependent methionine synthase I
LPIWRENGEIFIGDIRIDGDAFAAVADGSSECFVMVCTLGMGVDRLIAKEQHLSVSDAFFIDAVADAMIEALCDAAERDFTDGLNTSPRFSPGYADLPLEVGKSIVGLLGADRRLGITFSESGLMIPRKSVSAIVCIKDRIGDAKDEKHT